MELFPKEFVPELNTKTLGNSTSFLIRKCGILIIDIAVVFCFFFDRTAVERIFNFPTRIGQNSGSPEYHFKSQLSDGLINSSKRLGICELRQSKNLIGR
jgi:hypothetical protein